MTKTIELDPLAIVSTGRTLYMSTNEIKRRNKHGATVTALAELNACSIYDIQEILTGKKIIPDEKLQEMERNIHILYEMGYTDIAISNKENIPKITIRRWRDKNGLKCNKVVYVKRRVK